MVLDPPLSVMQGTSGGDHARSGSASAGPARGRRLIAMVVLAAMIATTLGGAAFMIGRQTSDTATPTATSELDALLQSAVDHHEAGRLAQAKAGYEQVLEATPGHIRALYNLGLIAQTQGDADIAHQRYAEVLMIDPGYVPALYNSALLLIEQDRLDEAVGRLRTAVGEDPENARAWFHLGSVLTVQGHTEEGSKALNRALTLDPTLRPAG